MMNYNEAYRIYKNQLLRDGYLWLQNYVDSYQGELQDIFDYYEDIFYSMQTDITGDAAGERKSAWNPNLAYSLEELSSALVWDKYYREYLDCLDVDLNDVFCSPKVADIYAAYYVCDDLYEVFYSMLERVCKERGV